MNTSNRSKQFQTSAFGLPVDDDGDDDFDEALAGTIDPDAPLRTPEEALDRVRRLVQTAWVERWWLLLLDSEGRQLPVLPQLEMPYEFGEGEAERLAETLGAITEHVAAASLVVVWELPNERSGTEPPGPSMLAASMTRLGAPVPTQVLVRRGGRVCLWRG